MTSILSLDLDFFVGLFLLDYYVGLFQWTILFLQMYIPDQLTDSHALQFYLAIDPATDGQKSAKSAIVGYLAMPTIPLFLHA